MNKVSAHLIATATATATALLVLVSPLRAAEITDVADADDTIKLGTIERYDPYDFYLGTRFELFKANGKIAREPIDGGLQDSECSSERPQDCRPVNELDWSLSSMILHVDAQVALYRDLALTVHLPVYLQHEYSFTKTGQTTTIDPTGSADDRLFGVPSTYAFGGLGQLELGVAWGVTSDERSSSLPSWVLFFNWSSPWTSEVYDPVAHATRTKKPMGTGIHMVTFGTRLSKRVANLGLVGIDKQLHRRGYLDPYFSISYTLPIPDRSSALDDFKETPGNPFGMRPSHLADVAAGLEIVAHEDYSKQEKVALDLGMRARFNSEGRNYSILSAALQEPTYTEQFLDIAGRIAIVGQPIETIKLIASFDIGSRTDHFLTNENVGEDRNGDNQVDPDNDDMNPYFCGNTEGDLCQGNASQNSYDQIGFRFRDQEHSYWSLIFSFVLTL